MDISADTASLHSAPPFSRRPDITLPAEDDPTGQDPVRPEEGSSEPAPPRRRRRGWLLATAATLGLVAVGTGFALSPYNTFYPVNVGSISEAARRAAEATGLIAPAARLAQAPAPLPTPAPARPAPPPPANPEAQRSELLSLYRGGAGAPPSERLSEGQGVNPAAAGSPDRPGTVEPPRPTPATQAPTTAGEEGARPQRPVQKVGAAAHAEAPTSTPTAPGSGNPTAASPAMAHAAPAPSPSVIAPPPAPQAVASAAAPTVPKGSGGEGPGDAAAGRQAALTAAAPPPLVVIPEPAAPPASAQDPAAAAANLRAAPMASSQQIEVLGLVTQMGVIMRDQREEVRQMREDLAAAREALATQLSDFNRRLSLAEARGAVSAAMGAAAAAPHPESPAAADGPSPRTAQDSGRAGERRRYRIQAASPGLAMLAEIDRSGEAGASLQIAVGDEIPGYGRVQGIVQEGSTWIVRAERGSIQ